MFEALEAVNTLQKTFLKELIRLVRDKDAKFANLFVRFVCIKKVSVYFHFFSNLIFRLMNLKSCILDILTLIMILLK